MLSWDTQIDNFQKEQIMTEQEKQQTREVYIGDGVYCDTTDGDITLTTKNGIEVTNRIILENDVAITLLKHLKREFPRIGDYL